MVHKTRVLRGTSNPQWREDFMVRGPGWRGPGGGGQGGGYQGGGYQGEGTRGRGPGGRIKLSNQLYPDAQNISPPPKYMEETILVHYSTAAYTQHTLLLGYRVVRLDHMTLSL